MTPAASRRPSIAATTIDRKSTRLNSSHLGISYAVFCLKKKKSITRKSKKDLPYNAEAHDGWRPVTRGIPHRIMLPNNTPTHTAAHLHLSNDVAALLELG